MHPRRPTVWDNVPARVAQAADESVFDTITGKLSKIAETGIQGGVKSYLDAKADAHVAELVGTLKLVATFAGGALILYLLSQSERRR